jgi:hypothetical protein
MSTNGDDRDGSELPFPPVVGYVYAVVNRRAWPGLVKLGYTGSVRQRMATYQTGDPYKEYRLIAHSDPHADVKRLEALTHERFKHARVGTHPKCEWFRITEAEAIAFLNTLRKQPLVTGLAYAGDDEPDDWYADDGFDESSAWN